MRVIFTGYANSGKSTLLYHVLGQQLPLASHESVEYWWLDQAGCFYEFYTCTMDIVAQLILPNEEHLVVYTHDMSQDYQIDLGILLSLDVTVVACGTKNDLHNSMEESKRRIIKQVFGWTCQDLSIPYLFSQAQPSEAIQYLHHLIFHSTMPPESSTIVPGPFKPLSDKQQDILRSQKAQMSEPPAKSMTIFEPEDDLDGYCSKIRRGLDISYDSALLSLKTDKMPVIPTWHSLFELQ